MKSLVVLFQVLTLVGMIAAFYSIRSVQSGYERYTSGTKKYTSKIRTKYAAADDEYKPAILDKALKSMEEQSDLFHEENAHLSNGLCPLLGSVALINLMGIGCMLVMCRKGAAQQQADVNE
ncbi:MAG: hypothetical protein JWR26_3345 [Pedosphaera sp.]|nr:hypothetical protein [Pedosphaera sp.]